MNILLDKGTVSGLAKYIAVGTGIGISAIGILHAIGSFWNPTPTEYWVLAASVYVLAAIVGYFCHRHFTFKLPISAPHGSSPIRFFLMSCCAAMATAELASLLYRTPFCASTFGAWNAALSFGIAATSVSVTGFGIARAWVFRPAKERGIVRPFSLEPIAVFFLGLTGFVAWSLYAGRDLNWDFLNYHLYLGQTANGARLHQDFFPASIQSYLSPYAYWPMAAMISAKWPASVVGAILGALHSLVVVATWHLARQLFPDLTRRAAAGRLLSTIIGVLCPLVLTQVGNSFADLTTAIPVILGLGLLLRGLRIDEHRLVVFAVSGMLLGLAVGLKLTNAIFGIAAIVVTTAICFVRRDLNKRAGIGLIAGQVIGFLLTYGYWGTRLWIEFGNPLFPGFNTIFQSPDFPLVEIRHQRFLPAGLSDWLLLPLHMLDPVANVYTEISSPDVRFLAFFCLAPLAVWRARHRLAESAFTPLLAFFGVGWVLCLATSGNGRYMMPLAIIVGPLLVWCIVNCVERRNLVVLVLTTTFACVQVANLWLGATFRWSARSWQPEWISATIPEYIRARPYTFLTFGSQSTSWLVKMVHPESRLVNVVGQYAIPVNGPGWARLSGVLRASSGIVVIFPLGSINSITGDPHPRLPTRQAVMAQTYGLRVDLESCAVGKLDEPPGISVENRSNHAETARYVGIAGLFFCRATFDPSMLKEHAPPPETEQAFDRIEDSCPQTFSPRRTQTVCLSNVCMRLYFNSDTNLRIGSDGIITFHGYGGSHGPRLGSLEKSGPIIDMTRCNLGTRHYVPWSAGRLAD